MLRAYFGEIRFHSPDRSGVPSGVRGAGAERFGLPSAVRGIPERRLVQPLRRQRGGHQNSEDRRHPNDAIHGYLERSSAGIAYDNFSTFSIASRGPWSGSCSTRLSLLKSIVSRDFAE